MDHVITFSEKLQTLWLPFIACLVVIVTHGYLGIHVIARQVIFVDIALAQIAAVGATVAVMQGYEPDALQTLIYSLGFATFAACVFSITRSEKQLVPLEAIIGLSYAIAAAVAILLADRAPHGAEHLEHLIAGNVLFAKKETVQHAAMMYAFVLLLHCFFGRKFLLISENPEQAYHKGLWVRGWDFLFYLTFSMVITHSIQIVGVLLVFCYLVAPAVFGVLFAKKFWQRLLLGWCMSVVVTVFGLYLGFDFPTGPSIAAMFAVALVGGGVVKAISSARSPALATCTTVIVAACLAGTGWTVYTYARPSVPHTEEEDAGVTMPDLRKSLLEGIPKLRVLAAQNLAKKGDKSAVPDLIQTLQYRNDDVKKAVAQALNTLGAKEAVPQLKAAYRKADDGWAQLAIAQAIVHLGSTDGLPLLLQLAKEGTPKLVRPAALHAFLDATHEDGQVELDRAADWWKANAGKLEWDESSKMFAPKK